MFGDPSDYQGNYQARQSTTRVGTSHDPLSNEWIDESPVYYSSKQPLSYKGNKPLPFKGRKNKRK